MVGSEAGHGPGRDVTVAVERADANVSLALQQTFFVEIASRYPGWAPASSQSVEPSDLAPPNGVWLVAYLQQSAIGCGGLQRLDVDTAEIRRLFLDASARGRRIGHMLLSELESHARRLGYKRVRLTAGDRQPEALHMFQAAGYLEILPFTERHWMEKRSTDLAQKQPGGLYSDGHPVDRYARIHAETKRRAAVSATAHLHDPQTLYRHWESEQWNPWAIDLARDKDHWRHALSAEDKALIYWALSSLMVAEERITTQFSGLVMTAESEEEATFLASQQVDEARHMQFYARFQDEVIAAPATIADHVARSRQQLGEPFAIIFDQALVSAHKRLVANPADRGAKVDFVTTYHVIIEGTLGLTAFEFITRYLRDHELLPGFVDGYSHIHHDEQRHIGYGVWFLREAAASDDGLAERIRATLRELLPSVAHALAPPDSGDTDWEALGATSDEIRNYALTGLTRRLNIIGVPLNTL